MIYIRIFVLFFLIQSSLFAEPVMPGLDLPNRAPPVYAAPTHRFNAYHNYESILQTLKSHGLTLEHRNFFESVIPHEELGFFGYHSSIQRFRIFQDIIRIVIEEIYQIPIKEDFHFLRIPGTPSLSRMSAQQFLKDYPVGHDGLPEKQEQLLSMNYSLFGNFNNFGSSSVYFFTTNHSWLPVIFENKIRAFFATLGLPEDAVTGLFEIGNPLRENDAVLMQFFDFSHHNAFHKPYELVERLLYEAHQGGLPNKIHANPSELYLGDSPEPFNAELRLVINNADILNPFSPLTIKRYERNAPEVVREYELRLREAVKALPYDPEKVKMAREELLKLWGQDDA